MTSTPSARKYPFIASADNLTYFWGGKGDTEPEAVFIYSHDTRTWTKRLTRGPHPPAGLGGGGCAVSGHNLHLYGGYLENNRSCGDLYELDIRSLRWKKLSAGSVVERPGKKYGCRMISYQDQLLVVGGTYHRMPRSRQDGAEYIKEGTIVRTNEVHVYSLTSGKWSSPPMEGSRPPPCSSFSLTMTGEDRAVMFGGLTPSGKTSKAWVLRLSTMTWSQHEEGDPWPESRYGHIAACLGYGELHQRLLISGGYGDGICDDMWLLDPQSGGMEKLRVPEKYKKIIRRYGHGAAAVTVNSHRVDVILFSGIKRSGVTGAHPVVLRFEFQEKTPKGDNWSLTDITDSTQLGSPAQLASTMRRLKLQLKESRVRQEELKRRAEEFQTQLDGANRRAEASNRSVGELRTQLDYHNRRIGTSNRRAREFQTQVNDANRRTESSNRRAETSNRRAGELQTQEQSLTQRENRLQANSIHWVIRREEIEKTEPEHEVWSWATVTLAKFRGIQVAVKKIRDEIISRHNLHFQSEMNMAARLRHPNINQFIGATMEGEMMIVMEFMATSLRSQILIEIYFQPRIVKAISLDVARGLNYLHLIQPDTFVHRGITSATVLLEQLSLNSWRAKLSDCGFRNFVFIENSGSSVYAAPEASISRLQSPKLDIYSFGVLLLEMLTGLLPEPNERPDILLKVQHEQLVYLIKRCLRASPEDRPSASDIICELNAE